MRAGASPGPVAARWAGWATAGLVVAGAALAAALVWVDGWAATEDGLELLVLLVLGVGVAALAAVLVLLALGLLRRRGWARSAAVVGFSLGAVAALSGLLGPVNAGAGAPPAQLAAPAVALAVSVAVVVLALVPATARDFRNAGQPPAPRRPGSS